MNHTKLCSITICGEVIILHIVLLLVYCFVVDYDKTIDRHATSLVVKET